MTPPTPFAEHDTAQAVSFLEQFHPRGPWHVAYIAPDVKGLHASTHTDNSFDDLANWIEEQQGETNAYFCVNELRHDIHDRKATKKDVVAIRAVHVDVDDPQALHRIRSFVPKPTVIVFSGGGYQAFWLLKVPSGEIDRAEAINRMIADRLGGDNCHNVDRLMRIPGTINMPDIKKRARGRVPTLAYVVEEDWTRTYSLDDFTFDDPGPAGPKGAIAVAADVRPVDLAALPTSVDAHVRGVIEIGDDRDRPRDSEVPRYPSRSEAVFYVCCELARAGCPDEIIAGILINSALRISESVLEKRRPAQYALKQARSARAKVQDGWPDVGPKGVIRFTMRNAVVALVRMELRFGYDLFQHQKIVAGQALEDHQGEISDDAVLVLRGAIIDQFGLDFRSDNVRDAVTLLCLQHAVHPIRDMLAGLVWDGVPRIDRWLATYLGAAETKLNEAFSRLVLIAAVRRIRQPGTKFDEIMVLEGKQGSGKSSALKILAGPKNHSDQEILTRDAKEQMELMAGVWIYELSEVEGMSKAETNKIKAFASRTTDRSRMAFAHFPAARPRQAIFIGTTNDDKYLRDQTGNRRFWPVRTDLIDLKALERDRDQLWAEAAMREARGDPIGLPEDLWEAAAIEQAARLEEDPWFGLLQKVRGHAMGKMARVSTSDLLEKLGISMKDRNQGHTKRIAALMRKLGWADAKYRVGDQFVRGYERPKPADHRNDEST